MRKFKFLTVILSLMVFLGSFAACSFPAQGTHTCESVCEVCGGCTDEECTKKACKEKCTCEEAIEHTCESVCPECGGCTDEECEEEACENKCDCEEEPAPGPGTEPEHTCESVCPDCGGCTDAECEEEACANKCDCEEEPAPGPGTELEHTCESVCPECGGCTDAACTEEACANKCQGHTQEPAHTCESVCGECGGCTDADCTEEACENKCPGHVVGNTCESACRICGNCRDVACTEEGCEIKCPQTGYVDSVCEICGMPKDTTGAEGTCDGTGIGHAGYVDYINYQKDVFKDKTALFIGDSICAATSRFETNTENRGWPGRIEYSTTMDCVNEGVSGASLSTVGPDGGVSTKRILTQYLGVKDQAFDFVIMEGGINDAMGSAAVGNITTSFNVEDFDINTYAGALEELFYHVTKNHSNAKLGYMFTFKTPNLHTGRVDNIMEYYDVAKQICEKWNVPFLNMFEDETLNKELKVDTNECLQDWLHPNTSGYDVLYKYIMYWMETLPVYSEIEEGYELETMPADVLPSTPQTGGCSGFWTEFC